MNRPLDKDFDPRNPATWPDYCAATRLHPLTRQHQRCVRLKHDPESAHTWETP